MEENHAEKSRAKKPSGKSFSGRKRVIRFILSAAIIFLSLFFLERLLVPKYADDVVEGAFIAEYYREKKDFDVIFVGDCEVYENFSPAVLWRDWGINSYIRGSAEQYIWQSYYILEDTLRYETPGVVVFNVQSLQFDSSQSEAYNRMTLEGMRWSPSKVKAIMASMKDDEHFLDYVFPILRYHSRYSDLTEADFKYLFSTPPVSFNGYYMRVDTKPVTYVPPARVLGNYAFGDNAVHYLDLMRQLCDKKGVRLILIKAPSIYPHWYDEWEEQVESYAEKYGLTYINFLKLADETGIDYNTDTYDAGLHMNLSGAEKLATWMGRYLRDEAGLSDRRGEKELAGIWEDKLAAYEAEKNRQYDYYGNK